MPHRRCGSPGRRAVFAIAIAITAATAQAQSARMALPTDILGRWSGTSTCVKADWNRACNDEVVTYWTEPAAGVRDSLMFHAFTKIGDAWESMGDLMMGYNPAVRRWEAPFANARVRILWTFTVSGGRDLAGRLFILPDDRVGRTVVATRASVQRPPTD